MNRLACNNAQRDVAPLMKLKIRAVISKGTKHRDKEGWFVGRLLWAKQTQVVRDGGRQQGLGKDTVARSNPECLPFLYDHMPGK